MVKLALTLWVLLVSYPCFAQDQSDATDLVSRVRQRFESSAIYRKYGTGSRDLFEKEHVFAADTQQAKVKILLPMDMLLRVLATNQFKNQHQTGYSGGGGFDPDERFEIEQQLVGADLRKEIRGTRHLKETLPKYGLLEMPDFSSNTKVQKIWGRLNNERANAYGDVQVYFKDDVKQRVTFTTYDSGNGSVADGTPFIQTTQQRRIVLDFAEMEGGEYFEAHIWGKLTLDDVAYFVIPPQDHYSDNMNDVTVKRIKPHLEKTGIPVYLAKQNKELTATEKAAGEMRLAIRGELLYPEDLKKRRQFSQLPCRKLSAVLDVQ